MSDVDPPVVNRRKLMEAIRGLCYTTQPSAPRIEHCLDKLGLVISDMIDEQVEVVVVRRKS